jgi:hypothetical protein
VEAEQRLWGDVLGKHPNHHPLPGALAAVTDLECASEEPLVAISMGRFPYVLGNLLDRACRSVEFSKPAYHNGSHFREAVTNVHLLAGVRGVPLHAAVVQGILLAAAGHDFGHPGSSLRADAPMGLISPELGVEISNEQVSAILVDEILAEAGVDPAMRVFVARLIWATTFGGAIRAQTAPERLVVIADIAPNDSFMRWIEKSINTSVGERPAKPTTGTFTGFLRARLAFINDAVRPALTPEAASLGWDRNLDAYECTVQRLIKGEDAVLGTILQSMLAPYGVDVNL